MKKQTNKQTNKQTEILMDKPVYLGVSSLESGEILIYEFWYEYVEPKCGEKAKLCYIYTDMVSLYTYKQMIFRKTFQRMLKLDLILQIMNYIDHCLKEKIKK